LFHCYWRRPHAYLQEPVRRGSSVWTQVGPAVERRASLAADLQDGTWEARHRELLELDEIDAGARLLIAG
jgi:hypothetical protein